MVRRERLQARRPNEVWAVDFVADQLVNGSRFRALTVVDVFSREALAITVGQRLGADDVVNALNRLVAQRRAPKVIFADNGSEFTRAAARSLGVSPQGPAQLRPAWQADRQWLRGKL